MNGKQSLHENYEHEETVEGSTDRNFGLVFSVVFALIAGYLWHTGRSWWMAPLLLSALFMAVALLRPALLTGLNRGWTRFGLLLYRVVNPVMLALIFFGAFLPIGLLMRLSRKDPMRRRSGDVESYWIIRNPAGPAPETMKNPF